MDEIIDSTIKVEWDELGEGLCGDYDPDDPEDIELLRFSVYKMDSVTGEWEPVDDASYCTLMPVTATPEQREFGLKMIMEEVYDALGNPGVFSIKRVCQKLSWIGLDKNGTVRLARRY